MAPQAFQTKFEIQGCEIGQDNPCFIIAEVAQAHDGSLGMAHAYIEAVAGTGVDAIKFQTHIADEESSFEEPWRIKFSQQDETRFDYWRRMEFSFSQWKGLADHACEKGLIFLSSPFSVAAVEMLREVRVPAWKIASGEITDTPLFESIEECGLPVLLSTGMSALEEIDRAVERLRSGGLKFAVLQCYSKYPCPPERVGINLIPFFRDRYRCPVGLSDHSGTIFPGLSCAMVGGNVLEVHVTIDRRMFGPDVVSSVTIDELEQLVKGMRFIERMQANPVDKDTCAKELVELRKTFCKSVVARLDLETGTVLEERHLAVKKPGTGFPANNLPALIGRRLRNTVKANHVFTEKDLV